VDLENVKCLSPGDMCMVWFQWGPSTAKQAWVSGKVEPPYPVIYGGNTVAEGIPSTCLFLCPPAKVHSHPDQDCDCHLRWLCVQGSQKLPSRGSQPPLGDLPLWMAARCSQLSVQITELRLTFL
jgi:hypothetical protein